MANPYESPSHPSTTAIDKPPWQFRFSDLAVAAWLFPLLLVGSLYIAWMAAWASLGHRPRPMLDDPKYINPMVDMLCAFAGVVILSFPAMCVLGPMLQLFVSRYSGIFRAFLFFLLLGTNVCAVFFLRWDPLNVVEWYFD